ncbi:MAG: hypothetical protein SFX74_07145 [Fimbriimonadaceae bacterium]|nr:hypothetical protein [Fimbriimonadaceae bacterium]
MDDGVRTEARIARHRLTDGVEALRANAQPFGLTLAAVLLLGVGYYQFGIIQRLIDALTAAKVAGGIAGAALANIIASLLIPELAKLASGMPTVERRDLPFLAVLFGIIGIAVDLLYAALAKAFGTSVDVATVLKKMMIDMFMFTPLVSMPLSVIGFALHGDRYEWRRTRARFHSGELAERYISLTLTAWCFWIPAVCVVYAMPSTVQFMVAMFAEAGWALLLVHLSKAVRTEPVEVPKSS